MKITIPFLFALLCGSLFAQVALTPPIHPQFLNSSGQPLSGGFLFSYSAGTTSLSSTYADPLGQIPNPDPIPLDISGAPSNNSVQIQIWLGNNAYKFCAFNSSMVQQWCSDNITGYLGLLNQPNIWTSGQTFNQIITSTQTDNQFILGSIGNQITLDFPPCSANCVLHFPNISGTVLSNPNPLLINPTINGTQMPYTPGTYISLPNQNPTGTLAFTLAKLINAPSQAITASTTDSRGIEGIVVSGAGITGNALIQQTGIAPCVYDAATTAGDYVQASPFGSGFCHDSGGTYPTSGQVIGRVLSTNATGNGYYDTLLFGPEANPGVGVITTLAENTQFLPSTTPLALVSGAFLPGSLNAVNKAFRISAEIQLAAATTETGVAYFGFGNVSTFSNLQTGVTASLTSNATLSNAILNCQVAVPGSSGTIICTPVTTATIGTVGPGPFIVTGIDLRLPVFVGTACGFSVGNGANSCTTNAFVLEQLN